MQTILKKYKILLTLLLAALLLFGLCRGFLLLRSHKIHRDRAERFRAALAQIDPKDTAITYSIPYGSSLFSPQNIAPGRLDTQAQAALDTLLNSMVYDPEGSEGSCSGSDNILVDATLPAGRMTLSMDGDALCYITLAINGADGETAAYTYDTAARDALLACGGLPTIAEMKAAIEKDLQNSINNLGDLAHRSDLPKCK